MKYFKYLCLLAVSVSIVFAVCSCRPKCGKVAVAEEEPLLLLDDEPPLLLDELDGEGKARGADNSRCHVCHLNFATEELAVNHARGDVGCEDCHGASDEHCSDEDNITPPDIMFPDDKIKPSCLHCHLDRIKNQKRHRRVLLGEIRKTCTDCHGKHKMSHRTRTWNKRTGELLSDDKVRMLTDDMLKEE